MRLPSATMPLVAAGGAVQSNVARVDRLRVRGLAVLARIALVARGLASLVLVLAIRAVAARGLALQLVGESSTVAIVA